jgi:serralysin
MSNSTGKVSRISDYLVDGFFNGERRSFSDSTITYNAQQLGPTDTEFVELAMDEWVKVSNVTFVETDGPAQVTFRKDILSQTFFDIREAGTIWSADVVQSAFYQFENQDVRVQNWMHEIGHALGLGHAGPYNGEEGGKLFPEDSTDVTVMSYFQGDRTPLNPQGADHLAIWELYGKPEQINEGDTTYNISETDRLFITDTSGTDTVLVHGDGTYDMNGGATNESYGLYQDTLVENLTVYVDEGYSVKIVGNSGDNIITIMDGT